MICQYLETWTEQQVFDHVVKHLRKQNAQCSVYARDEGPTECKYRFNGMKCAAGSLIPDFEYTEDLENKPWNNLVKSKIVPKAHQVLIRELQVIHDREETSDWEEHFQMIAKVFSVKYTKKAKTN